MFYYISLFFTLSLLFFFFYEQFDHTDQNNEYVYKNDTICGQKAVFIRTYQPSDGRALVHFIVSNFLTPDIFIFLVFTHIWPFSPLFCFFLFSGCDVFVSVSSCLFLCLGHFLCAFLSFTTVFRFVLRKPFAYIWRRPRIQYIVHDSHRSHAQVNFHTELYIIFRSCVVFFSYSSPVYSLINSFDTCITQYAYHVI